MLDRVDDRLAIADVINTYSEAVDTRNFALFDDVFLPDTVFDYTTSGTIDGLELFRSQLAPRMGEMDLTQHLVSNIRIRFEGEGAHSTCYLIAQHVVARLAPHDKLMVGGLYTDQWTRSSAGWRISRRKAVGLWATGNPAVLGAQTFLGLTAPGN